jgi:uncharacterized membrane protein YidH (DUF202 family)
LRKLLGIIADGTSISDFCLNIIELQSLRKEQKKNLRMTIGTHLVLSALAVGVSMYQTNNIIETIRKEAGE